MTNVLEQLKEQYPDKIHQEEFDRGVIPIIKTTICGKVIVYSVCMETNADAMVHLIEPIAEIGPEDLATIQAMYSRSNKSVLFRFLDLLSNESLEQTKQRIVGDVHKGYGHASIGDLGSFVLCYEGVSMLAAKAIQDTQLYDGQEASTRYITFKNQPFLYASQYADDALFASSTEGVKTEDVLQESWRNFYLEALPVVKEALFAQYPWEEQGLPEAKKGDYERAIGARSFDIIRGFLPAGCSTNLAWYTSIRHCADHVAWMRCHPLREVVNIAWHTKNLVERVYPTSFEGRGFYEEREEYKSNFMTTQYYLEEFVKGYQYPYYDTSLLDRDMIEKHYRDAILKRPKGQEIHYSIGEAGTVRFDALLDFASFRDQQRHRAVIQRHGLISGKYGFHQWYLDNLPSTVREKAEALLHNNLAIIKNLVDSELINKFEAQYLYPMGMNIPTRIVGHLGKVLYMVELRAQKVVHPTYHENAFIFAKHLQNTLTNIFDEPAPIYVDSAVGEFSWKRGGQTIFHNGKAISDSDE